MGTLLYQQLLQKTHIQSEEDTEGRLVFEYHGVILWVSNYERERESYCIIVLPAIYQVKFGEKKRIFHMLNFLNKRSPVKYALAYKRVFLVVEILVSENQSDIGYLESYFFKWLDVLLQARADFFALKSDSESPWKTGE